MRFDLDKGAETPLYRQLADQLRRAILSGRLAPGDPLPSVRQLAATAGVSHVTAVKAFDWLAGEGLIRREQGRGSFVAPIPHAVDASQPMVEEFPQVDPDYAWQESVHGRAKASKFRSQLAGGSESISFALSYTDSSLWPTDAFSRILRRLADRPEEVLQVLSPMGDQGLRQNLGAYLERFGIACTPDEVMITAGTQQGIDLVVRTFVEPGGWVVCEEPTYAVMLDVLESLPANVLPIPVDEQGLRIDLLQERVRGRKVRLIYTMPTFQNPTGYMMSEERRRRLLEVAGEIGAVILEDDPYPELYFDKRPPQPLKALDTRGRVIYLSGLTKMLCPGIRLGVLVASGAFAQYLADAKVVADLFTNTLAQHLVREYMSSPEWRRRTALNRERLKGRRDRMAALARELLPGIRFSIPGGGMNLWLTLPEGISDRSFQEACRQEGLHVAPGYVFFANLHETQYVRFSFGCVTEDQIAEGMRRAGRAWRRLLSLRGRQRNRDRLPLV